MKLCLFRAPRLDEWEARPLHAGVEGPPLPGTLSMKFIRAVGFEAPGPPVADGPHQRVAAAIRAYRAFPPWLVSGVLRRVPVEAGDTIGIQLWLLPGVSLIFACRVAETFDDAVGDVWRSGFTYRTVVGHPELGAETFSVEKDMLSGRVTVALRSWSKGGLWLTRLFDPFVRFMQRFASNAALRNLERIARAVDKTGTSALRR